MTWELVIVCMLAALALSGWVLAELELRETSRWLAAAEHDLAVALGWEELTEEALIRVVTREAVVHPTLHAIDGGEQ